MPVSIRSTLTQVPPPSVFPAQVGFTPDPSMLKNFLTLAGSFQGPGNNWPSFLTSNNLPTGTMPGANIFGTFQIPSNVTPSTTLVLAWTGTVGAIQIARGPPGFTVTFDPGLVVQGGTGANLNVAGTNGYVEFNFTTSVQTPLTLSYGSGSVFSGMTSLIVCRKSDYAAVSNPAGPADLITDDYVNAWKALRPKTIRFLGGWNVNETAGIGQFRYRPDFQHCIFTGFTYPPSIYTGPASGTNAYTVAGATDTPAAYTNGEALVLGFTNASTSTPITINVASRGVVNVFNNFGSALASGAIPNNAPQLLIYDDILGGYICYGSVGYGGSGTNVPIEILVALCNRVGCNMWLNLPMEVTMANSTMEPTNSVTQYVQYIAAHLTGDLYLEFSNEVWNFFGSIGAHTSLAVTYGSLFGFPSNNNRQHYGYYGYKVITMEALARAAWSGSHNLKIVNAFQGFGPSGATNTYRLQGADLAPVASGGQGNALWNSYTGSANYTAFPNRPVDKADTLAYATYWSGTQCQNFDSNYVAVGPGHNLTNISQANPGVLTFIADPGFSTGTRIVIFNVNGMTQVNGNNYSLTKLTATTYSLFTDQTLSTTVNTTGFTAYTSGGFAQSYPPISGLTSWADLYATLNPTSQDQALQFLDADLVNTTNGQTTTALNSLIYPTWETITAGYDGARPGGKANLTIELYEGALESIPPSTGSCTTLGIATTYSASINTLLTAYKNSTYFYNRVLSVFNQFKNASPTRVTTPVWFLFQPGGNQWSMGNATSLDIYGGVYQSYYAVRFANTGQ